MTIDLSNVRAPKSSGWSELENVARQVILAAKLHHDSYTDNLGEVIPGTTYNRPGYTVTLDKAAEQAQIQLGSSDAATKLTHILLATCWNDALAWATETSTGWQV